ncbi:hypothetical protein C943_01608 [Mariniradius saccharolyticus AK6]|uniref:Acetoacetate decarboxylase n=1 Tax=Mariniradius saccharolyticus AK6 TaxID=1239962 RepID=M7XBQ4_9BACT|nr:hypothetical protein [Mariniradius saccharolyticus]EMS32043.1 hypothetical protein C943_01608 [Mariniradius saccharolyticus AK6]
MQKPEPYFPAPWKLQGEGFILAFRFKKQWIAQNTLFTDEQKVNFSGGLGYLMLVNYQRSPVGPYYELLLIPGKSKPNGKQTISHIFVDSESSTKNGRYNWGIPKQTVPFLWQKSGNLETIGVGTEDNPIFFAELEVRKMPFPVSTSLLPIRLEQEMDGKTYLTNPTGKGWGKFAKIRKMKINADLFPDVTTVKPLFCVKVKPFHLEFPQAE